MAQHGYLHDTYDRDDFGRGDGDRDRSWRDRDDERSWRSADRDEQSRWRAGDDNRSSPDRDRGSMFGSWRDQDRYSSDRDRGEGRGFFERTKDEAKEWFGGDDRNDDRYGANRDRWQDRSRQNSSWSDRAQGAWDRSGRQGRAFGGFSQSNERYSAHPDDHYRSWRDKQMEALDRDYQDYCREREQQFHSDFDSWRQNRQGQGQGQQSLTQSQAGNSSNESLELDQVATAGGEVEGATPSPMGAATMGTNNSENDTLTPGAGGRAKR